jgi:tetratricopeptide (TPR) repeat protein
VDIVCIAEITEVMKSHYLEARLVDVETTEIFNIASKVSNISNASDIVRTADAVAYELVAGEPKIVAYSFREVEFNPDGAIADYTDAIRQKPNMAEYYIKRAYAYYVKEDYDRGISDYKEALRLGSTEVEREEGFNYSIVIQYNVDSAGAYSNIGYAYFKKGDYNRAIADFTEAIRLNPNNAEAYNNRGAAYEHKGDYDRAIADFTEAIRLDPNNALAYYNRGRTSHKEIDELHAPFTPVGQGYYNKVIADYTQAIRLDPKSTDAYAFRGNAYSNEGHKDKAISDYTEAIRLNPNYAWAYYNRGREYLGKDDNKAISDFTQAIRLDPNNEWAYFFRGGAYYRKKDYKKTIADYESALQINPNHPYAQDELEEVRGEMKK